MFVVRTHKGSKKSIKAAYLGGKFIKKGDTTSLVVLPYPLFSKLISKYATRKFVIFT